MLIGFESIYLGSMPRALFDLLRALGYATAFVVLWGGWRSWCVGSIAVFVVWYEEPSLERRFGEDYRVYRRTVRRWLPRFAGQGLP
jgi:protein-S-isoprenylcysteine O-methyltransferase Ste14